MSFTPKESQRYQRHIQLNQIGAEGQKKLLNTHLLIVGAGGLGNPSAQYLGASGIGHITIVDADVVSRSNLHRQTLFADADIGRFKSKVIAEHLKANNPDIRVTAVCEHLTQDNANTLIKAADFVIDGTDNFATRYLINDTALNHNTPWLFASVVKLSGQAALFTSQKNDSDSCFRCLFPQAPQNTGNCNSDGVLSSMPGIMGTIQANEALKYLAGVESPLKNTLLLVEGASLDFNKIAIAKNKDCICNQNKIDTMKHQTNNQLNGSSNKPDTLKIDLEIDNKTFKQLQQQGYQLIDCRTPEEHLSFNIGGVNVPLGKSFESYSFNADTGYLIYCQVGHRSSTGARILAERGIKNVFSLRNGIQAQ